MSSSLSPCLPSCAAKLINRSGDTTRARIRDPQELHLCAGAADGGHPAQGRQGAQGLGLGDWQEEGPPRAGMRGHDTMRFSVDFGRASCMSWIRRSATVAVAFHVCVRITVCMTGRIDRIPP